MNFISDLIYKFKRHYNIQNATQSEIVKNEIDAILKIADIESTADYRRESKWKSDHDSKCPLCGNTKIVNKISRVEGHGEVNGSFSLGFGSVYGSMDIDTNDVNHCSSCGNQWKKYKINYKSNSKMLEHFLYCIDTHIEGKYSFADDTYNNLKEFKAETIYALINSNHVYTLWQSTRDLELKTLRKHFKSVFDLN